MPPRVCAKSAKSMLVFGIAGSISLHIYQHECKRAYFRLRT